MSILETIGVERHFTSAGVTVRAVDGIDLEVADGEFVSVMGPSGCGKSTLLHLMGGLDRPTGGEIHVAGERVDAWNETRWAKLRRRRIGFVFQSFNLVDNLSARDNLVLPAVLAGQNAKHASREADELLAMLGLADRASASPAELSGGERQRVAIGRAVINRPDILLADEPTGSLDSAATTEVLRLIQRLHTEGQTVVMVTHDHRIASAADRMVSLRDGQVVDDVHLKGGTGRGLVVADLVDG